MDFYNKLEGSVNRHAPLKKLSPKEIKTSNKPWLSTDILKMIKIKNRDNLIMKTVSIYITYHETELIESLKNLKKQHYAEYFSANLNNIKKPGMALGKL